MKEIRKFRDMPDWPEVRKALKEEVGRDPNLVAEFGDSKRILWTWSKPLWRLKKRLDHVKNKSSS